jgi:methylsterol monooxygenase/4-alpha-methyl-delta7-sterol-4alpha-methyl oxidase
VSAVRTIGEATAMILLYDFGYYLMHRFGFHSWSVGRRIHSVHHSIRTPYTPDSLYIHPAETAAGVSLFLVCMAIVGPVGVWSFALAFLVYSVTNLFIHSGLDLPFAPFNLLTAVVRHHDIHHDSMKAGYYASITPIWDLVFGTARHREEAAPAVS